MTLAELETLLREFLEDQRRDKADGYTLRTMAKRQLDFEHSTEKNFTELRGDMRGHSLRIGELERDQQKIAAKVDDSGRHQLESLAGELEHRRDDNTWIKRHALTVATSVVVAIFLAAGGVIFGMLLRK